MNYRWSEVTGTPFICFCKSCKRKMRTNQQRVFADLNGEAFNAYYCAACASMLEIAQFDHRQKCNAGQ